MAAATAKGGSGKSYAPMKKRSCPVIPVFAI
jgi:hypothetical protein